jgi:hypothetical protein
LSILNFLPQTLEWNASGAVLLLAAIAGGFSTIPALAMLALGPLWALYYAGQAPIEKCHRGFTSRLLVAWLAYSGPIVRAMTRYRLRLQAATGAGSLAETPARQRPQVDILRRSIRLEYWNEKYTTRDSLLEKLQKLFARGGHPAIAEQGWNDFDLEVHSGPLTGIQITTAEEEHGGLRLKSLVRIRVRISRFCKLAILTGAFATAGATLFGMDKAAFLAAMVTIATAAVATSEACESIRRAYRAVEQCAEELELIPLSQKTRAARRKEADAPEKARPSGAELVENSPLVD